MDRRTFIRNGCLACAGATVFSGLLDACISTGHIAGELEANGIKVPLKDFELRNGGHRTYLVVRQEALQYPVCIYRVSEREYTALWLSCSHQGAELQVNGDRMTCPAHGSEFDKYGQVQQGPAAAGLRSFPVTIQADHLFIDLRKKA